MIRSQAGNQVEEFSGENSVPVRRAFYLTSQGSPIFAWVYQGVPSLPSTQGVIICPPLGHEQVHAHRTLRHLAERLALAGLHVLRFDYFGTGDSAGMDEDAPGYTTWLANLRDAMAWMRENLSCHHLHLLGLRMGAALAFQAASEQEVVSLILWEPVVQGRTYVREMKVLNRMAGAPAQPSEGSTEGFEVAGFWFARSTWDELEQVDLLKLRPLCRRVLLLNRDDLPSDGKLLQYLTSLEISQDNETFPGYAAMLAEPHYTRVPEQAISYTVNWLISSISAERERSFSSPRPSPSYSMPQMAPLPRSSNSSERNGPPRPIREHIIQICKQPDLFGILCEPETGVNLPLIVLSNAGSAYHVGPGRLYVVLARRLAALGFRCLRFDLSGLGDSVTSAIDRENHSYPATGFRDIELTLQYVRKELGVERVVLMGLCSGAYFAFQSAVQNPNPALIESVLINPLTYYWHEGLALEASPVKQISALQYYLGAALQPGKWLKLLRGRTKIGIFGAGKVLAQRLGLWPLSRQKFGSQREDGPQLGGMGHPEAENYAGDLDRVVQAGRRLACFFACSDAGYGLLMYSARSKVKKLSRTGQLSIHFIEDADHTFSQCCSRQILEQALADYLCKRYPV